MPGTSTLALGAADLRLGGSVSYVVALDPHDVQQAGGEEFVYFETFAKNANGTPLWTFTGRAGIAGDPVTLGLPDGSGGFYWNAGNPPTTPPTVGPADGSAILFYWKGGKQTILASLTFALAG